MTTELIRRASIVEICAHRERAIEKYRQAFACLDEARDAHALASPHQPIAALPEIRYRRTEETLGEIAVMAAGIQHRTDRLSAYLRDQIDARGGSIHLLPEGSFESAGTGVRTVLVTIPA